MLGILGGTFDPIHAGHLHIANAVVEQLSLDQLQLIPCALPVHRDRPQASAEHRCNMIELAIADNPSLSLNSLELRRGGPSYSVDSLRQIRAQTEATLVMVLGSDAFNGFDRWRKTDEILRLANLVICHRPGVEIKNDAFAPHWVTSVAELRRRPAGAILLLEVAAPKCSASELRAAIAESEYPERYLPPAVLRYIKYHQLYRENR